MVERKTGVRRLASSIKILLCSRFLAVFSFRPLCDLSPGLQLYSTIIHFLMHFQAPLPKASPHFLVSQAAQIFIHLKSLPANHIDAIMPLARHRLPLLVSHAPPATFFR
jgi:hypothetical protein